jgi:sorbitol/mannitol transport system permease protein
MWPSVVPLLLWMIVPLAFTIYFSFIRYNLLNPANTGFAGFQNYQFLVGDASFWPAILNTLIFIGAVLIITVVVGVLLAVLYDQDFWGKNIAMLLVIAPFFVMPTVSALIWKNMIMHPVYGAIALFLQKLGIAPIDWFADLPLISIIIIVSWEWIPFSFLILVTALKSLDQEQKEAASIDGAGHFTKFRYIVLPHLEKAIGVVVMIEMIFLLSIFAEIYTTTGGGPGNATTTLAYLVYLADDTGVVDRSDVFLSDLLDGNYRIQDGEGRLLTRYLLYPNAGIVRRSVCPERLFAVLPQLDPGFFRVDYPLLHSSDSQRLSDGFLSNAEIAVDDALDVIDQNDAGGGRTDPHLHYLAMVSPFGHHNRVDHHLYLDEPANRGLDVVHLFL